MLRPFAALVAAALLLPIPDAAAQGRGDPNTLRVKLFGDLRSLDPFISPEYMARNHGYMVYDTLFALDSEASAAAADGGALDHLARWPHLGLHPAGGAALP